jgi:cell division protein FtsQ
VASATVVVVVIGLGWVVLFSPVLAVRSVKVKGTALLTTADVLAAARVKAGTPLVRLPREQIERRVEALPDVLHAHVTVSYPCTVTVDVTERTAAGYLLIGANKWALIDETGKRFNTVTVRPAGVLRLDPADSVATDASTLAAMAQVAVTVPAKVRSQLLEFTATGPTEVTLVLKDGRTVFWGGTDQAAEKVRVLIPMLRQPGPVYDISDPFLPFTR